MPDCENIKFCSVHGVVLDDDRVCVECQKTATKPWYMKPEERFVPGQKSNYFLDELARRNREPWTKDWNRYRSGMVCAYFCDTDQFFMWHQLNYCPKCGGRLRSLGPDAAVVESGRGGELTVSRKEFEVMVARVDGEPKFSATVIPLGGGWKDLGPFRTLKETVERAYWHASKHHTRYVNLNRTGRHGLGTGIGMMAGHNGRVWLGRCGSLSLLAWRGEEPAPGSAVEITGRYAEPVDWVI